MQSSFLANADVGEVSEGMMRVANALHGKRKYEKQAIIACMFNVLYNTKLSKTKSVSDIMLMVDNMRVDCKMKQIPEFGGAERYVVGEL